MVVNTRKKGSFTVQNDGITLATDITTINVVGGSSVEAVLGPAGTVSIYHPAPTFQPHWPDGVVDPVERVIARIATPAGGEGTPFSTGGWAGTNQDASRTSSFNLTSAGTTTGFGGDSDVTVTVYDANGVSILETYTTPSIQQNDVHSSGSGFIVITITDYAPDFAKFKARINAFIDVGGIFSALGRSGGRYHVEVTHTTDSISDNGQVFTFVQDDVFYDTNLTTPVINGAVTIVERPGFVLTKHLSGLEYYILNSQFTANVNSINQLNRNTAKINQNLQLVGTEYGLPTQQHSPFGTGSSNFSGWSNNHDQDLVNYQLLSWAISSSNYRYMGPTANISSLPRDTWNSGATAYSTDKAILIDTYGITSTTTFEDFDDEARRENIDGVGAAASAGSFSGPGTFDSTATLVGTSNAMVFNSRLMVPNQTTLIRNDGPNDPNTNWTSYSPTLGGSNPDYTGLGVGSGVNYGVSWYSTPGQSVPSFVLVFSGTFAGGNALADLQSGALEIYIYRIDKGGATGAIGAPPGNTQPLRVHVPFNFALYDDGLTVAGSGIREGASSGNTINCTFGTGTPMKTGMHVHIVLKNSAIQIDSISATFV